MIELVSVVLPVRNAAATIGTALSSLQRQTYPEIEIIVVDDASDDGTSDELKKRLDQGTRVLSLRTQQGVAAAAEAGRDAANGAFVARMDADDIAHPERIERQVRFLEANPDIDGCGTAVRLVGAPPADPGRGFGEHVRWLNGLNTPDLLAAGRFIDSPIANPSSMVRAAALEAVGGHLDTEWAEDYDLWLRLLHNGHALCNLPEVLLDWHDSAARLTRTAPRYSAEMFSRAKAHYLAKLTAVREAGVEIAGAGPIGKRLARHLSAEGVRVHCFWEVSKRRIGENIGGIEVRDHDGFRKGDKVLLGAVGQPGARDRLGALALSAGYRAGHDFFPTA